MLYNDENISFRVFNSGLYKHPDGCYSVEGRNYSAISYRVSGRAIFEINGETHSVEKGDIIFIPAEMPYTVRYEKSESLVVHLESCTYNQVDKITPDNKEEVLSHFIRTYEDYKSGAAQNHMKSLVFAMLAAIEEDKLTSSLDSEMARCVKYIDENYKDNSLTVERVCRDNYISHSSLQRAFLARFGMTPKAYVIKKRLKNAAELLLSGSVSCREAAYTSGFSDEKYFSRIFKKNYSVPPSKFMGRSE